MKKQSKRATFEDVKNAQKNFRELLDILINNNRCLNKNERNKYFDILALSTLGVGIDLQEPFIIEGNTGFKHLIGNFEYVAGWLAYQDNNKIIVGKNPDVEEIDIYKFWKNLRDMFLKVRGHALKMGVKISAEQIKMGRSTPEEI